MKRIEKVMNYPGRKNAQAASCQVIQLDFRFCEVQVISLVKGEKPQGDQRTIPTPIHFHHIFQVFQHIGSSCEAL